VLLRYVAAIAEAPTTSAAESYRPESGTGGGE
jgi:hypothetical protein